MAFLRVQHLGICVRDLKDAVARFDRVFGLEAIDFRDDQGRGFQLDARILLGNECWLHLVQNWNPDSRFNRFLQEKGEGLEHIAIETDDIEGDVERLRSIGIPIFEDTKRASVGDSGCLNVSEIGVRTLGIGVETVARQTSLKNLPYPSAVKRFIVSNSGVSSPTVSDIPEVTRKVDGVKDRFDLAG